jgi:hypothetical protein
MGGFDIDFVLGMIRTNVAGIAGFRFSGLLQTEFMPEVAFLALSNRPINTWFPNIVAAFTGKPNHLWPFQLSDRIARFIGREAPFWDSFIHREVNIG